MLFKLVVTALLIASLPGVTRKNNAAITQAAGSAAVAPLPVKMGLWEATITNSMSPKSMKTRACMSQQSYQNAIARMPPGCTISNKTQTATSLTGDVSCTMQNETTKGHIDVEMPDSTTMHSVVTLTVNAQGQSIPMTLTTDSHFVSADCGDIAPGESKIVK